MSTPPSSPGDDPSSRYSFSDPPRQQAQQPPPYNNAPSLEDNQLYTNNPRYSREQFRLSEEVADVVEDTFDIPQRMLGCAWWSLTLPFRLIGKIFDFVGDMF